MDTRTCDPVLAKQDTSLPWLLTPIGSGLHRQPEIGESDGLGESDLSFGRNPWKRNTLFSNEGLPLCYCLRERLQGRKPTHKEPGPSNGEQEAAKDVA